MSTHDLKGRFWCKSMPIHKHDKNCSLNNKKTLRYKLLEAKMFVCCVSDLGIKETER